MEYFTKLLLYSYLEQELANHEGISINLSLPYRNRKGKIYFKVREYLTELEDFLDSLFYFSIPTSEILYIAQKQVLIPLTIFNIGDHLTSYATLYG